MPEAGEEGDRGGSGCGCTGDCGREGAECAAVACGGFEDVERGGTVADGSGVTSAGSCWIAAARCWFGELLECTKKRQPPHTAARRTTAAMSRGTKLALSGFPSKDGV